MTESGTRAPVVLLCFNRPAETAKVMACIRAARPHRLHVVADAPRAHVPGEAARCAEVRRIATDVDWPCEVITDFANENMGCRKRVSSGLTNAFRLSERLIVLEDDCIPSPEFFPFCEELLERYRDDGRIFSISGNNFQQGRKRTPYSYFFSQVFHCWGWASWRRAWETVDLEMRAWPEIRDGGWLKDALATADAVEYCDFTFEHTFRGKNDSWAFRAGFASLSQGRVNIHPSVNLVQNIGVGGDSTHNSKPPAQGTPPAEPIAFPLLHPPYVVVDRKADQLTYKKMFGRPAWRVAAKRLVQRVAPQLLKRR